MQKIVIDAEMPEDRMASQETSLKAWSTFVGAHALCLRGVEAHLKAAGLPPLGWYDVLWELERAGGELRVGELAERLVIEPYNATRLLDRLASEGLLRRERAKDDRRGARAIITEKGRALRRRMWPAYQRAVLDLFAAPLSEAETKGLLRSLTKVIIARRGQQRSADSS
jgi:DNA-binding MarR family transcriptional regulator